MHLRSSDFAFIEKRFETTDLLLETSQLYMFKAREKSTGKRVLLKYLKEKFPLASDIAKLKNHFNIVQHLSGDFVVHAIEHWREDGVQVLVLEDLGGGSLRQFAERRLSQNPEKESKRKYLQAFHIASKIAQALQHFEKHAVCHGSLSPDSVWTIPSGSLIRLCDYSYAQMQSQEASGTWHAPSDLRDIRYMAPEIDSADPLSATQQSDFYSLGAVLYFLLEQCSSAPNTFCLQDKKIFPDSFLRDVDLSAAGGSVLQGFMGKLLHEDPSQRPSKAAEVVKGIRDCIAWLDSGTVAGVKPAVVASGAEVFKTSDELFGRESEMQILVDSLYDTCCGVTGGCSFQVVKITGRAGMGKSALSQKFLRAALEKGSFIARGQYGQYRSDEPLSAILSALSGLLMQILTESTDLQGRWRDKMQLAMGEQAGVLVELLPALEELLGPQPKVSPIAGELAVRRLSSVVRQFLSVFYEPGYPLVVYLDDLQWADQSSIRLLDDLCKTMSDARVLLVLAYRNDQSVALMPGRKQFLNLAEDGDRTSTIELHALSSGDIAQIVAKALGCSIAKGRPLAQLVEQKTAGDPFYIHQFLHALYREGQIEFSPEDACWVCDLSAVRRASLTEHVVTFMSNRLQELEAGTLEVLQVMSCLGARVDIQTLARSMDRSRLDVARLVWTALSSGLVVLEHDVYKFQHSANDEEPLDEFTVLYDEDLEFCLLHDRVRQAAYSLIPATDRGMWHAQLGKRLLAHYERGGDDRSLFDILDKLGSGLDYIDEPQERLSMSALCMQAGVKARAYIAYNESLSYLQRGINVLGVNDGHLNQQHRVMIHLEAATSALLASRFNTAFEILGAVEKNLNAPLEILQHALLSVQLCCLVNRLDEALEQGYKSLERFDRRRITDAQMAALSGPENVRMAKITESAAVMEDQVALMLMLSMTAAAFYTTHDAYQELVLTQMQFCMDRGGSPNASLALCNYGTLFIGKGQFQRAFDLYDDIKKVEQSFPCDEVLRHKDVLLNSFYHHWHEPLVEVVENSKLSADRCIELGDYIFASYAAVFYADKAFFCCQDLAQFECQVGEYAEFTGQVLHQVPHYQLSVWHQVALNLIDGSMELSELEGSAFSERQSLPLLEKNKNEMILFYFYFSKALLALHFDQPVAADRNIVKAKQTLQSCSATYCGSLLAIYEVIVAYENNGAEDLAVVMADYRQIGAAQLQQQELNLGHYDSLLLALECSVSGEFAKAKSHYAAALDGALHRGMVHDALFIKERMARFYAANDMRAEATDLFEQSYHDYNRWGARAKADHLRRQFSTYMPIDLSL